MHQDEGAMKPGKPEKPAPGNLARPGQHSVLTPFVKRRRFLLFGKGWDAFMQGRELVMPRGLSENEEDFVRLGWIKAKEAAERFRSG